MEERHPSLRISSVVCSVGAINHERKEETDGGGYGVSRFGERRERHSVEQTEPVSNEKLWYDYKECKV